MPIPKATAKAIERRIAAFREAAEVFAGATELGEQAARATRNAERAIESAADRLEQAYEALALEADGGLEELFTWEPEMPYEWEGCAQAVEDALESATEQADGALELAAGVSAAALEGTERWREPENEEPS